MFLDVYTTIFSNASSRATSLVLCISKFPLTPLFRNSIMDMTSFLHFVYSASLTLTSCAGSMDSSFAIVT